MKSFFCKLLLPWAAESCFDAPDDFYQFLLRRNRLLNAIRVILFAVAAVALMLGYALDGGPYNTVALIALVIALAVSLVIIQNEKQLPREYQKDT